MLALLDRAIAELPDLLAASDGWRGMRITYHPPQVDRAWRPDAGWWFQKREDAYTFINRYGGDAE